MFNQRKYENTDFNVWPCFVDALSSLLILIIFIVMGFFISQVYLSNALNDSDSSLKQLQLAFYNLQSKIQNAEAENINLKDAKKSLEKQLEILLTQINELKYLFKKTQENESKLKVENKNFSDKISELAANIASLNLMLETTKKQHVEKEVKMKADMELTIAEKIDELKKISEELKTLKKQIPESILQNPELLRYRSEFFALLQNVIGGRSDIRTVDDRFVFQSEVLFEQGSNEIGKSGQKVLNALVKVLKEIALKIPKNIHWVLVIDGHTDKVPIHNDHFDSNWELSASRAVSVVKYLIIQGVAPEHLAAASFAEYFPLTEDVSKMAKNRRIEIRLDQR
ncbi:MAG: OmpA family protein [Holosporales bacterium]|jgi:chemotaxis protein MotB|nr:OmpA family protein [Holosporales bacterium]